MLCHPPLRALDLRSREWARCREQCQACRSTPPLREKGEPGKPAPGGGERGQRPLPSWVLLLFFSSCHSTSLVWKPRQLEGRRIKTNIRDKQGRRGSFQPRGRAPRAWPVPPVHPGKPRQWRRRVQLLSGPARAFRGAPAAPLPLCSSAVLNFGVRLSRTSTFGGHNSPRGAAPAWGHRRFAPPPQTGGPDPARCPPRSASHAGAGQGGSLGYY